MGAGGRREKEAAEGGICGKAPTAEDMRQVEGVRGTTEKRNGVRGYWEDMGGTRHRRRLPVGQGKAEENEQELSLLSSSLPGTARCSAGLTWD